jgi:hypothetical protein
LVYPPATPVDVMVIPRASEKMTMPKLMIGCQGQWRAGLMNHDIFQCDAIKTQYSSIPSFHHSNCERSELSSWFCYATFRQRCISSYLTLSFPFSDNTIFQSSHRDLERKRRISPCSIFPPSYHGETLGPALHQKEKIMDSFKRLLIYCMSVPGLGLSEEELKATIKYILNGRDYKQRVNRANKLQFTFLPPYEGPGQPRPMNIVDRFFSGGWRKSSWEEYDTKAKSEGYQTNKPSVYQASIGRRLVWAFLGAIFADAALGFIIWLLIMMGISELGLENKIGLEIDPINLLIWIWIVFFVLFFLGFLGFIKGEFKPFKRG